MEIKLIVSQIQTPDGTILRSNHVHDYVTHIDANGEEYMLDGGIEYQRVNQNIEPYIDISIYTDSPFEEIRKYYCRGGRGKDGRQPLTWVPLCGMSDSWLKACIVYNDERGNTNSLANYLYAKELRYRQRMEIFIKDED